jgi:flagellar hook-length control protein FliK
MGESSGRAKADASLEALSGGTKSTTPSVNHERTLSDIERVRFVQRVARAMHTSVDRGGELSLRLSPPELGSLRLQVSLREGAMQVRLEAETNAARGALLDNLPLLRERLAEQNIRIDKFDVDLRQPGDNTSAGGFADRSPEDALPGKSQRGNRPKAAASAAGSAAAIRTMRPHPDGQLNIIV